MASSDLSSRLWTQFALEEMEVVVQRMDLEDLVGSVPSSLKLFFDMVKGVEERFLVTIEVTLDLLARYVPMSHLLVLFDNPFWVDQVSAGVRKTAGLGLKVPKQLITVELLRGWLVGQLAHQQVVLVVQDVSVSPQDWIVMLEETLE
jgi:hypothetical protein